MSNSPHFVGTCISCLGEFAREQLTWKPLVAVESGLYYPGEPFCGDDCYDRYVDQAGAKFLRPTDDQKVAFRRAVSSPIRDLATVPFVVHRKQPELQGAENGL